jgi:hypothetical protein
MAELHDLLERESERFTLPQGAEERMFARGHRRERNRRLAAIGMGAVLFLAIVAIVRSALPGGDEPRPAIPTPVTPRSIAGTYTAELRRNQDEAVRRLGLQGAYELRLERDGTMQLSSPRGYDLSGAPVTFSLDDDVLTTDALVGAECASPGSYRVRLQAGILSLRPVQEPCELRRVLLTSRPWTVVDETREPLEGEWTATFSCERMVRTVHAAPASLAHEELWLRVMSEELGSADPSDPCASDPPPMTFTLRFSNGHVWVFDGGEFTEGFDGDYELVGRNILRFGDRIDGPFRAKFKIEGDRVTFDLIGRGGMQPFFVGAWESAPFVKRT